jgi:hypothetical protein|tara:strand:+ start:37 stop:198 length:162 start_codon:yes stop_codon:yes gene_type:complete
MEIIQNIISSFAEKLYSYSSKALKLLNPFQFKYKLTGATHRPRILEYLKGDYQ